MSSKSRKEEVHDNGELYCHHRHNVERRRPAHPPCRCQAPPDVGNMPIWRPRSNAPQIPIRRRPHSTTLLLSQQASRCNDVPRLPPKLGSSWHPSPRKFCMVSFQTKPPAILWPLLHSTHPPDPFPSTVGTRLHQGVRFPHPSTSSCPAGCTSIFGTSPSPSRFKFFFLY